MEEKQIEMKRAHRLTMEGRRCRLTLEKGEVDLDGKIDSLTYTGSQGKKADRNGSLFKRMFQ